MDFGKLTEAMVFTRIIHLYHYPKASLHSPNLHQTTINNLAHMNQRRMLLKPTNFYVGVAVTSTGTALPFKDPFQS